MSNFTDPIKAAFGVYLHGFHSTLVADTAALREYSARAFSKAAVWAPGRMIDQVEDMITQWRKNETDPILPPKTALPIMIAAMAKDFTPAPPEYGRGMADPVYVTIPSDPKQRVFKMRAALSDQRTQVAIAAADDATARSLAMQLHLYVSSMAKRTFYADFPLAGITDKWPVVIEMPELMAMNTSIEGVKNMTVLVVDLTLRAAIPVIQVPKAGEPNDGKGTGTVTDPFAAGYDPSGYMVVAQVDGEDFPPHPDAPPGGSWVVTSSGRS